MLLPLPDPFERFAAECGLRLTCDELCTAPRDVLTPLDEAERHVLVTVSADDAHAPGVKLIFSAPLAAEGAPPLRDVLWWIAGDAWAIERSRGAAGVWAATYGYPPEEIVTARLYACHARQAAALRALLGPAAYERLVALYDTDVAIPRRPR